MIPMLHLHLVCKLCTLPGAVTQIKRKAVFPAFLWQGNPCGRRIPRRFPRPTGLCGAPLIRFPCRALTEHAAGAIQHCETGMQVKAGRKAIIRNGQSSMHLASNRPPAAAFLPEAGSPDDHAHMQIRCGIPARPIRCKTRRGRRESPFQPKAPA